MFFTGLLLYLAASRTTDASRNPSTDSSDPEKGPQTISIEQTLTDNEGLGTGPYGSMPRRFRRHSSATVLSSFSNSLTLVKPPSWVQKFKVFVFPPKQDINSFMPNYRITPIFSGIIIPFSILLELPGVTEHWYIRTEYNKTVESRPNTLILNVGLGISVACAVTANICLILRFMEKRVKTMTILCTTFLSIHDVINITAVTIFGVEHRFDDGFTYGQAFWMTVCSTAASSITNGTLIWDLIRTPDFNNSGSGLTRNQRSLVIIIMILFCYICFGALINSLLQDLTFISGLYFTLVSIETIGFGDIVPKTTGARVFVLVYSIVGILNLGVAIAMCRETVLEALEVGYRKRVKEVRSRRKEAQRRRRIEARWRQGIEWRLREMNVPVWIRDENWVSYRAGGGGRGMRRRTDTLTMQRRVNTLTEESSGMLQRMGEWLGILQPRALGQSNVMLGPSGMQLNLTALTHAQLEASALEAGVPLSMLLPSDFVMADAATPTPTGDPNMTAAGGNGEPTSSSILPGWAQHPLAQIMGNAFQPNEARTLTHARVGGMASLITRFAVAVIQGHATSPDEHDDDDNNALGSNSHPAHSQPHHSDHDHHHHDFGAMEELEKKAFYEKLFIAWSLFLVFWFIGSAIFSHTEKWSYGVSMYFCFVAFSTIGFGDFSPQSPAGRSVFVVWAILGVGTMTIMISVLQEAYNSRYRNVLYIGAFHKAVKRYRHKADLVRPAGRRRHRLYIKGQGDLPSTSHSSLNHHHHQDRGTRKSPTNRVQMTKTPAELHAQAQDHLEALPEKVLHHAKLFHQYIRFFVEGGHILHQDGEVCDRLRGLLDEIVAMGGIGKVTKDELLQDEDARHTLFMLSIEKALNTMVDAAEDTLEAIQERDILAQDDQADNTSLHRTEHIEEALNTMVDGSDDTVEAIQERDVLAAQPQQQLTQDDQADNASLHRTEHTYIAQSSRA